jgi:hypothetical protein
VENHGHSPRTVVAVKTGCPLAICICFHSHLSFFYVTLIPSSDSGFRSARLPAGQAQRQSLTSSVRAAVLLPLNYTTCYAVMTIADQSGLY